MTDLGLHSGGLRFTHGVGGSIADYIALMKPRVMSLVVFTALVGMALAPIQLHPALAVIALICIAVGAGASGALNMCTTPTLMPACSARRAGQFRAATWRPKKR